jgi:hypothetical protein
MTGERIRLAVCADPALTALLITFGIRNFMSGRM